MGDSSKRLLASGACQDVLVILHQVGNGSWGRFKVAEEVLRILKEILIEVEDIYRSLRLKDS